MLETNHGHVVTIASSAGLFGVCGLCDYSASKFGAVGFDESLMMELNVMKKTGVHTTVVCPFFINTGMFDGVKTRYYCNVQFQKIAILPPQKGLEFPGVGGTVR